MPEFQKPFFMSSSIQTEREYANGVNYLAQENWYSAFDCLIKAAENGHVSATFNLSVLISSGRLTPFDIDFAADCLYSAHQAGHPGAVQFARMLDAADRAVYGTINLADYASAINVPTDGALPSMLVLCCCRYYWAICQAHDVVDDVIRYELDAARTSDFKFVHRFADRTGIPHDDYSGGLTSLESGSAADQITDGLNLLAVKMLQSGFSHAHTVMTRCTIVGYIISKSRYAALSKPLYGVDRFFLD